MSQLQFLLNTYQIRLVLVEHTVLELSNSAEQFFAQTSQQNYKYH